jgi:hypothetical protein
LNISFGRRCETFPPASLTDIFQKIEPHLVLADRLDDILHIVKILEVVLPMDHPERLSRLRTNELRT